MKNESEKFCVLRKEERQRGREREGDRERGREGEREVLPTQKFISQLLRYSFVSYRICITSFFAFSSVFPSLFL